MPAHPSVVLALFGGLLAAGCQPQPVVPSDDSAAVPDTGEQRLCTMEFRTISVTVVDAAGAPVEEAQVEVVRAATGTSIVCTGEEENGCIQPANPDVGAAQGRYQVVNDGIPVAEQEAFVVTATAGNATVRDSLIIGFDGCHVRKVAGPDTLRLAP